jgi:hypothetical protein
LLSKARTTRRPKRLLLPLLLLAGAVLLRWLLLLRAITLLGSIRLLLLLLGPRPSTSGSTLAAL